MADREDAPPVFGPSALPGDASKAGTRRASPFYTGSSYQKLADFIGSDKQDFMVYRRFAWLHSQALLHLQDEIAELEQRLRSQDELELDFKRQERHGNDCSPYQTLGQRSASSESGKWLLAEIKEKLSDYNSMILSRESLKRIPSQRACRYQSVREFLYHGPPTYMDFAEIQDDRWRSYESAVDEILQDPGTFPWLDGPLDPRWSESVEKQLWRERGWERVDHASWIFKARGKLNRMAKGGLILFWISHITAALGFVLIANASNPVDTSRMDDSSRPLFSPLAMYLFAHWYFSTCIILVQGLLAKGFVYARKTFLGGVLACLGGLYILRIFMGLSTASSLTAVPTLFTVVLLLIRTM